MEKKITISNNSKLAVLLNDLSKKKEETRKKLEASLIKAGTISVPMPPHKLGS